MPGIASLANTAWALSCRRERRRFLEATESVANTQRRSLAEVLSANADTRFARRHGLDRLVLDRHRLDCADSLFADYAARVPVASYDDIAPDIERIAAGEPNVLTAEPVTILQPTSGSTGGRKLIPLTASVRRQFQRAIGAWIADLFDARPRARRGQAYWSISPAMAPEPPTGGGIPVGFADDTHYLSRLERLAVDRVLAVPSDAMANATVESFRHRTLAHLVLADDLSLISVWSPTFLTTLLDELLADPNTVLHTAARIEPRRAARAAGVLRAGGTAAEKFAELWPGLDVISCWTDGSAAGFVPAVEERFPSVTIQPKGLLATEAFVSFPLVGHTGAALAVRSHAFEFLPVGDADGPLLAHHLEIGHRYEPLVTTGGGLYRYRLGDVIEVVGHLGTCPLIRFVGRTATADLVGEKLDESFVAAALEAVVGKPATGVDALVIPNRSGNPPHYVVAIAATSGDRSVAGDLVHGLEAELRSNPHYAHARDVGQLGGPVFVSTEPGVTPAGCYEDVMVARGVRVGDIKPTTLVTSPEVAADLLAALCRFEATVANRSRNAASWGTG